MEDALYEIASMCLFAKLSLDQAIPDRTTIMNFRHLLEQHQLARQLFEAINQWLCDAGIMMKQGTLVDATIIEAPTPPKTSVVHIPVENEHLFRFKMNTDSGLRVHRFRTPQCTYSDVR